MEKKIYLLFTFSFLFLVACNDDDRPIIAIDDDEPPVHLPCLTALDSLAVPAVNTDGLITDENCILQLYHIYPEKYRYTHPCFNPNNAEELAFIRGINETYEQSLCVFNFCSGVLNCFDVAPLDGIDWGTNGRLLFIGTDLQLWKMKPDGSELERLTTLGENSYPLWDSKGDRIAYSLTNNGNFFILDSTGAVIETREGMRYRGAYDWSSDDKLITPFESGSADDIYYYDLHLDTLVKVEEVGNEEYVNDGEWGPDGQLYWMVRNQLAYTDMSTKERTSLFALSSGANDRIYKHFSLSPDYRHIIMSREDWKQLNECDVEVVHSLYIMDIDGSNERKILIPEE
jgi:Tol biopolymer transport system component